MTGGYHPRRPHNHREAIANVVDADWSDPVVMAGVLDKYGVRVLGTPVKAIRDTEDRKFFIERLTEIGVTTARSRACPALGPGQVSRGLHAHRQRDEERG
jgi:hypothetical protein